MCKIYFQVFNANQVYMLHLNRTDTPRFCRNKPHHDSQHILDHQAYCDTPSQSTQERHYYTSVKNIDIHKKAFSLAWTAAGSLAWECDLKHNFLQRKCSKSTIKGCSCLKTYFWNRSNHDFKTKRMDFKKGSKIFVIGIAFMYMSHKYIWSLRSSAQVCPEKMNMKLGSSAFG